MYVSFYMNASITNEFNSKLSTIYVGVYHMLGFFEFLMNYVSKLWTIHARVFHMVGFSNYPWNLSRFFLTNTIKLKTKLIPTSQCIKKFYITP